MADGIRSRTARWGRVSAWLVVRVSTSLCVELLEKPIRRNQTCAYELCCSAGVFLAELARETAEGRIQLSQGGSGASNTQAKPDLTHGCRLGHFAARARHRQVICEESC